MSVYYEDPQATVYEGDCLDVLRTLPDESVDSVVTDPPYGLRLMNQPWDGAAIEARAARGRETSPMPVGLGGPHGGYRSAATEAGRYDQSPTALRDFQDWCEQWAGECLRILRPGGHLLAFGGSRTWHRLTAGIEDAGFEIRDSIAWIYGQGMPKSLDVARAITGHLAGVGSNTGALRRLAMGDDYTPSGVRGSRDSMTRRNTGMEGRTIALAEQAQQWEGWGTGLKPAFEPCVVARRTPEGSVAANVLAHGVGGLHVDACRVPMSQEDAAAIDAKHAGMDPGTYQRPPGTSLGLSVRPLPLAPARAHEGGRWPTNVVLDDAAAASLDAQSGTTVSRSGRPRRGVSGDGWGMTATGAEYDDAGGASRFFPVFRWEAKASAAERPAVGGVAHPTVKPLALMRWLVRLVTPYGGTVLEPFAGSGTTVEAALAEGMLCIAVEREASYLPLIRERIQRVQDVPMDLWGGTTTS
ncbi:DNA methyltransferase [Actinomyces sp. 594]|uniref:DNA-methyltransferase n=1 Tax=Actinomyces sp. 594 TaxID=2057793 RepID=UPI001C5870CA|nr:DNA methyltransferase [Actinomyces sp. 594]